MRSIFLSQGVGRLHFDEYAVAAKCYGFKQIYLLGCVFPFKFLGAFGEKNIKNIENYKSLGAHVATTSVSYIIHYFLNRVMGKTPWARNIAFFFASLIYTVEILCILCMRAKERDIIILRSGYGGRLLRRYCTARKIILVVDCSLDRAKNIYSRIISAGDRDEFFSPKLPFWRRVDFDVENADFVIFNSHFISNSYCVNKFAVVELPIRSGIYKSSSIVKDKNRIIFVGDFCQRKGSLLISNLSLLLKKINPNIEIHVFGVISDLNSMKLCASNVFFHGHVQSNELRDNLQKSSYFIFPTLGEGMARALVEALHLDVHVITTTYSGLPQDILSECTVIDNMSPEYICDVIVNMVGAAEIQPKPKSTSHDFSPATYIKNISKVFDDLLC